MLRHEAGMSIVSDTSWFNATPVVFKSIVFKSSNIMVASKTGGIKSHHNLPSHQPCHHMRLFVTHYQAVCVTKDGHSCLQTFMAICQALNALLHAGPLEDRYPACVSQHHNPGRRQDTLPVWSRHAAPLPVLHRPAQECAALWQHQ